MSKVAIMTDSTAYIPEHIRNEKNIVMIPLNVIFGNESYKEEVELNKNDFYEMVGKGGALPKTSQPSIGELADTLERLSKDYDEAIMITLSSGISGTYQSALSAADMVEGINFHVFDSEISCAPQAFYTYKAVDMAKEGANATEIMEKLNSIKERGISAYFVVDDLNHLHRGGRMNAAQLLVGNLLQIKPVLHFQDKRIVPFEKIRTKKKAIARIHQLMEQSVKPDESFKVSVINAQREEEAKEIAADIQGRYPSADVSVDYFGPVIGTHLGEGSIGITWMKE
ncbi:DegV family protein [Fictibacillus sp. KIGAM418]|uniref:DegV family protein n=1 Tax=Fictibacillus marinisediminis TaxID=2878389 RepID=A0A9X2BEI8_9BACL|nr:DegV family protein [Fictibacillus marinisediminis]MCK6258686.1 DegV family protein [Fictibacillus marinisediminis]